MSQVKSLSPGSLKKFSELVDLSHPLSVHLVRYTNEATRPPHMPSTHMPSTHMPPPICPQPFNLKLRL